MSLTELGLYKGFHSFEVGFGLDIAINLSHSGLRFHSFEVGFGHSPCRHGKEYTGIVFIPSR